MGQVWQGASLRARRGIAFDDGAHGVTRPALRIRNRAEHGWALISFLSVGNSPERELAAGAESSAAAWKTPTASANASPHSEQPVPRYLSPVRVSLPVAMVRPVLSEALRFSATANPRPLSRSRQFS